MLERRWLLAIGATFLMACSGSDASPTLVTDTTPTTRLSDEELLDGALERSPSETDATVDDDEPAADAAAESTVAPDSVAPPGTDVGGETDGDAATTTGDAGTTTGDDGGDTTGGTATGGATTGGATTGGATTGGTTGADAPVGLDDLDPATGVVTIGDLRVPFAIEFCDVQDDGFAISAPGTGSDGQPYQVLVTSTDFDIDGDGQVDQTLEVNVIADPPGDVDSSDLPDYYVVGAQSGSLDTGFDVEFTLGPDSVVASGTIADNNGVALSPGTTVPMTVALRCS